MKRPSTTRAELRRQWDALASATGAGPRALVLTVCTGNICRSPPAEVLLRGSLPDLAVEVASAGTHALVGHSMPEPAQQIGIRLGADAHDAAAHEGRLLTESMLESADLVLAMSREHRARILRALPAALRRTFTVREFARRASQHPDAEIRAAAEAAGHEPRARIRAVAHLFSNSSGHSPDDPADDDVIDPYRQSTEVYELSASQLQPALRTVEHVIRTTLR